VPHLDAGCTQPTHVHRQLCVLEQDPQAVEGVDTGPGLIRSCNETFCAATWRCASLAPGQVPLQQGGVQGRGSLPGYGQELGHSQWEHDLSRR
jgi:hypothetical protein